MSIPLYVRKFKEEKMSVSNTDEINVSNYFPKSMYIALQSLQQVLEENNYLLCPLYENRSRFSRTVSENADFQIGMTGKLKKYENVESGITRELYEELCIIPKKDKLKRIKYFNNFSSEFSIFSLDVQDAEEVKSAQSFLEDVRRDDFSKRVGCFVYGSKKNILAFLQKEALFNYNANDNITGIVAINLKDLYAYINE